MPTARRIGGPNSKNRGVLLDAAERLMLAEGYAAVTSRRVAAEADLKHQLVHYYFRTMDDLFLAMFQRRAEMAVERQAKALASDRPLRSLWELSVDPRGTALTMELAALATRRPAVRAEVVRYAEQFRAHQVEVLGRALEAEGISPEVLPPTVLAVLATGLSQVVVMEEALGMTTGHAEALAFVDRHLRRVEGDAADG